MTIRINGLVLDGDVNRRAGADSSDIELTVYEGENLSDENIITIKNATLIEELVRNYDDDYKVSASYNLLQWKSVNRTRFGTTFCWQTYKITDINQVKQDTEDLTQALLELAEIVGGKNG